MCAYCADCTYVFDDVRRNLIFEIELIAASPLQHCRSCWTISRAIYLFIFGYASKRMQFIRIVRISGRTMNHLHQVVSLAWFISSVSTPYSTFRVPRFDAKNAFSLPNPLPTTLWNNKVLVSDSMRWYRWQRSAHFATTFASNGKWDLFLIICKQIAINRIYGRRVNTASPSKIWFQCKFLFVRVCERVCGVAVHWSSETSRIFPFSQFRAHACSENVALKIKQFNFHIPTIYYVIYFVHST